MSEIQITLEQIAAAEALLGVEFSAAERALMRDNLAPQIEQALRRRAVALPADLGPATRFDPRVPGFAMPKAEPWPCTPVIAELPDSDEDIAFATLPQLACWIRARTLSATRLTNIYLARIARLNPELCCFSVVTAEAALRRAGELDAMAHAHAFLGPLHGIPYGMKDIIDTAGVETAWGAEPYRGRVPETDAHVTRALHDAGAILLGKTTVGALAYGDLWYGGRTRNPWNPAEGSSGSSAGSASAVAAGLAGFAIGTETLGSIVSPSTRCGTTGLRPTFGRVSRRGAMPLCWSLDKIGPICRAAECTAWVLQALCGADPEDPFQISAPFGVTAPDRRLTIGYFPADFEDEEALPMDREALAAARAAGHTLVELSRTDLPYDALIHILYAEAAASFEELTASGRDDELTWQDADAWPNSFRKSRFLSAVDHVQLDRLRRRVMQEMDTALRDVDVILGPSLAGPMLVITNFTGHPCLCQPVGFRPSATRAPVSLSSSNLHAGTPGTETEVPHSICLYGKLFEEGTLVTLGKELERQLGAHLRRPAMAV